jgi:hypothetical protein
MDFESLNETNCRIGNIKNNDRILIGGSFAGKLNLAVIADTDNFAGLFNAAAKNAQIFTDNAGMQKWLSNLAPDFNAEAFAHMCAFDNVLRKMYPELSAHADKRKLFYDGSDKTLSEAVNNGVCQCAEIAVLAQTYLQQQGFESKYFGGELLRSVNDEFGEPHSFITLKTSGQDYIYDPANPLLSKGLYLPQIAAVEATPLQKAQFEAKIHTTGGGRNCAFLEAKDILTKSSRYYGCGDGMNIFPSFIISKNNPAPDQSRGL